jgi:SAM-dependent methyltransferase
MNTERNTFAEQACLYANARPRYPDSLFQWIAEQCVEHGTAWDCATGNGQAAIGLARYFDRVQASDVSPEQIAHAVQHPRIQYFVASAEMSGLPDRGVDLIAVAQALHWFEFEQFWSEVRRVAKPQAVFCAWGYAWFESTPTVVEGLLEPFRKILSPYWASNNQILCNGYRTEDIDFPFVRLAAPSFAIEVQWTLKQLMDYMMTWSAFTRSRQDTSAVRAMDDLLSRTQRILPADELTLVRMPLKIVAGRVE